MTAVLEKPSVLPAGPRPDTTDMHFIHNVFRRLFGDLPVLVGAVADGDVHRARTLGKHVALLMDDLHHHHTTEDDLLWPMLLDKVELERHIVEVAEAQHERVHELLELVKVQVGPFGQRADAGSRTALAATLTELDAALCEHMNDEEHYVLPLVEKYCGKKCE